MKASDSVNSLTELTGVEKSCFICLETDMVNGEPLVDSKLLRNCGCIFSVHPACWNEWLKGKSDYDCPICRKDSMLRIKMPPNPVMAIAYVEEPSPNRTKIKILCSCLILGICIFLVTAIVFFGH